ncbi:MAG: metallophosphoesterase [Oscillospiraceae bacterium]|nr:metallophosphoesterase [Oscillospiraceae bacterium]
MKKHRKLKIFLSLCVLIAAVIVGYFLISGWVKSQPKLNYTYGTNSSRIVAYPDANFAIISDIHTYDPSLGTTGSAFDAVLHSDRKLLIDSEDLLDYAIGDILKSNVKFVLVSGDLTKDGELVNHEIVANKLKQFTDAGLKVYVIPGNHDINNPGAESYSGDSSTPVANITPDDFVQIYSDFGYKDALERDQNSLSYLAEPVDGLWLLAIDDCRYRENTPGTEEIVSGKISQATENWIESVLNEAEQKGKAVMVMIHHGVVEHWDGQYKLHPDYLIEDYTHFGNLLASYNVRIAFTGHYHGQDITESTFGNNKYLYDVQTGSLITAPCPIRYCSIKDNDISINSEDIVDKLHPGTDFAQTATAFVKSTIVNEAEKTLKKYKVSDADTAYIANAVGDAFVAYYSGDEDPAMRIPMDENKLNLWGRIVYNMEKYVLNGLWKDLPPADNNVNLTLN